MTVVTSIFILSYTHSTREDKVGDISKKVGKKTYNGLRRGYMGSKDFVMSKLGKSSESSEDGVVSATPVAVEVPTATPQTA